MKVTKAIPKNIIKKSDDFSRTPLSLLIFSLVGAMSLTTNIHAEEMNKSDNPVKIPHVDNVLELDVIRVEGYHHPSNEVRNKVNKGFDQSRSSSFIDGSLLQNLNPVNADDTLRYNAVGIINSPYGGSRFGGSKKIRTFGDFGAATSIDGLPAFRSAGQEGGGYTGTLMPSIAIETIEVRRGGQAIQYGDGTDGGTIVTRLKSGANYKNHQALSFDYSSVGEIQLQAEAAHGWDSGDYYVAGRWLEGSYDGQPPNLDEQDIKGLVGKVGWNLGESTRAEGFIVYDNSKPDIFRSGDLNKIATRSLVAALTVDHRFNDNTSMQLGYLHSDTNSKWPDRNRDRSTDNDILFINGYLTADISPTIKYLGSAGLEYIMVDKYRDNKWFNQFDDWSIKTANTFIFNDNLALNFGLRQTWFDNEIEYLDVKQADNLRTDHFLSYELGASYSVSNNLRLRTVAASGYNRFSSKYGNFGTDAIHPDGAEDEVVEALTLEVGANYAWDNGYVDIAVYNIEQDGVPRRNGGLIESMEVEQSGVEIEVFSALTEKLSLSAGYMHILDLEATREDGSKVNSNIFWGSQVTPVPENQYSLRFNYNLNSAWSFWSAGFYSSGFDRTNAAGDSTESRNYERIDVGTNWQVNDHLMLRFRVENITDQKDFGQTLKGNTVNDKDKIGQAFWLGVDYKF